MTNIRELLQHLGHPLCVLDIESTGGGGHAGIVEVAWRRINLDGTSQAQSLVLDPQKSISPYASRIHGYYDQHVRGKPRFPAVHAHLRRALDGALFSGFNSKESDASMLRSSVARYRLEPLPIGRSLDVRDLWKRISGSDKGRLADVADVYGVETGPAHKAHGDVLTTVNVLEAMIQEHGLEEMLAHAQILLGLRHDHEGQERKRVAALARDTAKAEKNSKRAFSKDEEIERAILDWITTHGHLGEAGQAGVCESLGCAANRLEWVLSNMYRAGRLEREAIEIESAQDTILQWLPQAVDKHGVRLMKPLKAFIEQRSGTPVEYVQLMLALGTLYQQDLERSADKPSQRMRA